jgi:hypothetical protein
MIGGGIDGDENRDIYGFTLIWKRCYGGSELGAVDTAVKTRRKLRGKEENISFEFVFLEMSFVYLCFLRPLLCAYH